MNNITNFLLNCKNYIDTKIYEAENDENSLLLQKWKEIKSYICDQLCKCCDHIFEKDYIDVDGDTSIQIEYCIICETNYYDFASLS